MNYIQKEKNNVFYRTLRQSFLIISFLSMANICFAGAKDIMGIKLGTIEFNDALISDAVRIIAEQSGVNIVATREAGEKVITVYIQNTTVKNVVDSISRVAGLWYRYNEETNVVLIMTAKEYQKDIVVFKKDFTKVYTLKQENVKTAAQAIEALYGDRVQLSEPTEDAESFTSSTSTSNSTRRNSNNRDNNNRTSRGGGGGSNRSTNTNNLQDLTTAQLQVLSRKTINDDIPIVSLDEVKVVNNRVEEEIFVTYNLLHNLLIVRTSDKSALASIEKLIKELDKPTPQVLLEMKILEVTLGDEFSSVFDFDAASSKTISQTIGTGNDAVTIARSKQTIGAGNFSPLLGRTLNFTILNDTLSFRMQLLQRDNRINTLATPLLMAVNNRRARIFIGQEKTLITGASSDTSQNQTGVLTTTTIETETRDIGTTLDISPRINADKTVTLRIFQDSSSLAPGGTDIIVDGGSGETITIDNVNTANMTATVIAKDGKTIAIGGLISEEEVYDVDRIPVWGNIPILGVIGSKDIRKKVKKEIILLITPHIFDDSEDAEAASDELTTRLSDHDYIKTGEPLLDNEFGNEERVNSGSLKHFKNLSRFAVLNLASDSQYKQKIPGDKPDPVQIVDSISWRMGEINAHLLNAYKQYEYYVYTIELKNSSSEMLGLKPVLFTDVFHKDLAAMTFVDEFIRPLSSSSAVIISKKTPYELFGPYINTKGVSKK